MPEEKISAVKKERQKHLRKKLMYFPSSKSASSYAILVKNRMAEGGQEGKIKESYYLR
jgi:hypothetical protein